MKRVILHLGGDIRRLETTIEVAKAWPDAQVIVSSEGSPLEVVCRLKEALPPDALVTLDYRAWDTVSNFTETYDLWEDADTVFLVSAGDHLYPRALRIADALGVLVFPTSAPPEGLKSETWWRVRIDVARAHIWRLTGWLPSNPFYKRRMKKRMHAHAETLKTTYKPWSV